MNPRFALVAVLAGAMSAGAFAQDGATSSTPADAAKLLQSCSNHKFETTVVATVDGKPRNQKVKICGVPGQTDADWKRTLEDAMKKVETNDSMAAAVKEQIVTALKLEIGRLDTGVIVSVPGGSAIPRIADAPKAPVVGPPVTAVRPAAPPAPRPLEQDYGNLQPLPPPLPPAATVAATAASASPRLPSPRIRISCSRQGERGADECGDVYQDTIFTVRADEPLASGTSLRFLRKGDDRGEVELAQLNAGQSVRVRLPNRVCTGVTRSSLEVQVMRGAQGAAAPQVVDSYGPYYLRC